jgi:hypothetical protein
MRNNFVVYILRRHIRVKGACTNKKYAYGLKGACNSISAHGKEGGTHTAKRRGHTWWRGCL